MRRFPITLAIIIVGAAVLYWQVGHRQRSPQNPAPAADLSSASDSSETQSQAAAFRPKSSAPTSTAEQSDLPDATTSTQHTPPAAPPTAVAVPDTSESTNLPPATILENMRTTIHQYGAAFGENPVGNNPEITAALHGENAKQIDFLKQDGNRVNAKGELVDAWGTPYFFHQLSAKEMQIRSAGPDRVMYTGDDLVTR